MKKAATLGFVGGFVGDDILPSYIGHYFINHEIRIPLLTIQDSIESRAGFFFSWLKWDDLGEFSPPILGNVHIVSIKK